jgi:hypothetical protein
MELAWRFEAELAADLPSGGSKKNGTASTATDQVGEVRCAPRAIPRLPATFPSSPLARQWKLFFFLSLPLKHHIDKGPSINRPFR